MSLFLIWTSNYQGVSLPQIYISSLRIDTNIYISHHPIQIIPSAPLCILALRVSKICSREFDFRKHISEMKTWFLRRGYPKKLVESEIKKVKFSHVSNNKSQKRTLKRTPLIVTYHPLLNSLGKVLSKNLNIFCVDEEVIKVFHPRLMVSFRSARKVSSYLAKAKVYPLERTVESFKC